ncbi:MAG: exodeoxyribonuclease VII large subunit [Steroidobacteraceae bacterium]|jgi:exodeoxyribonuclease VII large subunit|nr:exodeoxyribonuclease VII large subunit [Steroidobacteraceae bacterium]
MPADLELDLTPPTRDVYTPSRLNREARTLLERGLPALWIEGEISNLSRPSSGHWYFSLKDANAQLRCAMFRQRNVLTRFDPRDGMHVLMRGRVSLYEQRGDFQFIAEHIEEAGEGELRRRFELLKAKLAAEGLFAAERKRPLPRLPRRIGVVSSPTGAAVCDVLNILRRRFRAIPVLVYPTPVQGAGAAARIAAAIRLANARAECDVLILARGGGSLEDLWAFNEEIVARAIYQSNIPVISGVGHEVDFTIADFVADVRAPTPSGAAELVAPDCNEWLRSASLLSRRLKIAFDRALARRLERAEWLRRRLGQLHPGVELRQRAQRLDEYEQRLTRSMRHGVAERRAELAHLAAQLRQHSPALRVSAARARLDVAGARMTSRIGRRLDLLRGRLAAAAAKLDVVSPLATLQRGYAIVTNEFGAVVTDAATLNPGDAIQARLSRGSVHARVCEADGGPEGPKDDRT